MASKKHSVEVLKHTIQVNEELELHEKGWITQRVGWLFMILTMIAGVMGLFGEGFLSKKNVTSNDVNVSFDKFLRYENEMKIVVQTGNETIRNFSLPESYLKTFRLMRIIPEPLHSNVMKDDVVFHFAPGENKLVSIYMVPQGYGNLSGNLKVNGTPATTLSHFIYP